MTEIKDVLRRLVVEALRLERSPDSVPDHNLTAVLGIDSINSLELLILVESHFNIRIDDEDLSVTLVDSLDVLAAYVSNKLAANGQPASSPDGGDGPALPEPVGARAAV